MSSETSTAGPYIMYGSPPSLYSGKARSYLRKKGIVFSERLTCHPDYFSKIMPVVDRYVIPVIESPDGDIVQDTTEIIDFLESRHSGPSVYPQTPKQRIIALILELFGDEGLLRPAMHYRWSFPEDNDDFISLEFGRFMNPTAPDEEAKGLAAMPKSQMSGLLPALGVTPETIPAIEAGYHDLLTALDAHLLEHPYLLGGRPTIADFGMYAPLYAHLARDPAPSRIMKRTANRVWRWVERMTAPDLDKPEFPDLPDALVDGDTIPETLEPVLEVMAKDHVPELVGLVDFLNDYLRTTEVTEGDPIVTDPKKRTLGFFPCTIRDIPHSLVARHYSIWMLQRVQDAYNSLGGNDKTDVDGLLERTGLRPLVTHTVTRRIERSDYKEVWGKAQ